MDKDEIRELMREAYESVMVLDAQTRITTELAYAGSIDKAEAVKNLENALVEVRALRERHTALRQDWERM